MKRLTLILFLIVACLRSEGWAQSPYVLDSIMVVYAEIHNGDTLMLVDLPEVIIHALPIPDNRRDRRRQDRTVRNVRIVYPYAKLAGIKLREYEQELLAAESDRERRQIMKKAEDEIHEQFGDDLRKLTFTQGKILLKLIDRETGEASYDLVKDLRGSFTAFFYQAFARIWGFNLKDRYDPEGEDELIEQIVQLIEQGRL